MDINNNVIIEFGIITTVYGARTNKVTFPIAYSSSYSITLGQLDLNSEWDFARAVPSYHNKTLADIDLEASLSGTAYNTIIDWITIGF